jgi:predicted RNase H-like HicB family nuclease
VKAVACLKRRSECGGLDPSAMAATLTQRLTAILHREEDVYVAECPEVGSVSQGETIEEALANLREATELYLEECPNPVPAPRLLTTFEVNVA